MNAPEDERHGAGLRVQRELLGPERLAAIEASQTGFTTPMHDFVTRVAYGDVWEREGLDRRTRSCITIAVLAALGCPNEVATHARLGRVNGLSEEEISEVILHTALYAGIPRAHGATMSARDALAADDGGDGDGGR